jgi:hypothetical protein
MHKIKNGGPFKEDRPTGGWNGLHLRVAVAPNGHSSSLAKKYPFDHAARHNVVQTAIIKFINGDRPHPRSSESEQNPNLDLPPRLPRQVHSIEPAISASSPSKFGSLTPGKSS